MHYPLEISTTMDRFPWVQEREGGDREELKSNHRYCQFGTAEQSCSQAAHISATYHQVAALVA